MAAATVICRQCGLSGQPLGTMRCTQCGGLVELSYPPLQGRGGWTDTKQNGIWRYRQWLPPIDPVHCDSLGEGGTPLVRSRRLAAKLGLKELYFKCEGSNPTGSYKDRIAAVGVAWMKQQGIASCIGTTSGNAGASYAAYCSRAGIDFHVYVLEQMAPVKLAQLHVYGANVYRVADCGIDAAVDERLYAWIGEQAAKRGWEQTVTAFRFNPYAMEGVKTIAYEIYEQLGRSPDVMYAPVGGGGLFAGIGKGFAELQEQGISPYMPRMVAVQPEGGANIVRAFRAGAGVPDMQHATTAISGMQVPSAPDGTVALARMRQSGGWGTTVGDEQFFRAQQWLSREEGVFCEPASAGALAGLLHDVREGRIDAQQTIVCCLSGTGLKDERGMQTIAAGSNAPLVNIDEVDATLSAR